MYLGANIMAMQAHRGLMSHQNTASKALQRLSSGRRINSAADNAAGLAISQKMTAQIRGLKMASQNAQNAVSMLQTAEGGLNETHAILQRMRELAVQSANGTYDNSVDRKNLDKEYQAMMDEIDRISSATHFNGIRLLDGSAGGKRGQEGLEEIGLSTDMLDALGDWEGIAKLNVHLQEDGSALLVLQADGQVLSHHLTTNGDVAFDLGDGNEFSLKGIDLTSLQSGVVTQINRTGGDFDLSKAITASSQTTLAYQIGANGFADHRLNVPYPDASTANLGKLAPTGLLRDTDILTQESAREAIEVVKQSTDQVSGMRGSLGAQINRLGHTINNLENSIENLTAAESQIADADMAEEMMNFTKATILMQAAQAMMAQAMNFPRSILSLLNV